MNRIMWRVLLTLALMGIAATSALAALDYTIKGGFYEGWKPEWWDGGWMRLRAEWNSDPGWLVDEWREDYGAPPNAWEVHNLDPTRMQPVGSDDPDWWAWSSNGISLDYVNEDGILLKGGLREQDVDLQLGNQFFPNYDKYWYVEFELDHLPTNWWGHPDLPRDRLTKTTAFAQHHEYGGWIEQADPASGIDILGQGWVAYDDQGNWLGDPWGPSGPTIREDAYTLVWWKYMLIEPQPWAEKILWEFDNDGAWPTDDFRIVRVVTGTYCTPEPVTVALLAMGLPLGLLARRRRQRGP